MNLNLQSFLKTYFVEHQCDITYENNDQMTVLLTEQLDHALMNRPFYWHYIKSIGQKGEPMTISLTTNPNETINNSEFIHFGSPRYQQIVNHLQKHERYTKLYERIDALHSTPLFPWLLTNIKVTYKGLLLQEELFSIGLNLVNGFMKVNMMETLAEVPLEQTISDYCHSISPLITYKNGYHRIENVIINYIKEQDHQWSETALKMMRQDLALVDYFFTHKKNDEQYTIEKNKIYERYKPTISLDTISGGIVYLTEKHHKNME